MVEVGTLLYNLRSHFENSKKKTFTKKSPTFLKFFGMRLVFLPQPPNA